RSCVNHPGSTGGVLRPMWNETPLHERKLPDWFFRILADHRDWLGGCDVVARSPVRLIRNRIEVLLDKLLRILGVCPSYVERTIHSISRARPSSGSRGITSLEFDRRTCIRVKSSSFVRGSRRNSLG